MFRIRYKKLGGHMHCRLFATSTGSTWACCGDFIVREEEFPILREEMSRVEFLPMETEQ